MSNLNRNARDFIISCERMFGSNAIIDRDQINAVIDQSKCKFPFWLTVKPEYRVEDGKYMVPVLDDTTPLVELVSTVQSLTQTTTASTVDVPVGPVASPKPTVNLLRQHKLVDDSDSCIPSKYPNYIPFGFYADMKKIIKTEKWFPIMVTGHSGCGKTLMVEQVCAELKRECIRVNISIETDESDLLGGPTLVDGNVVNRDGPVLIAMKRGAVLIIDEVDRGSNKLMCLQSILEGKPYFNKKSGEMIYPKVGFNVVATANTKGQGSEDGKYLAQILDSAFLNRFIITVEQDFPNVKVETEILTPLIDDVDFVRCLTLWAEVVRKSFKESAIDEIISTRHLVHIAKTYEIFSNKKKAIELCINRFDDDTKTAFLDLYSKIDGKPNEVVPEPKSIPDDEEPF
jgi:hypothetical protein